MSGLAAEILVCISILYVLTVCKLSVLFVFVCFSCSSSFLLFIFLFLFVVLVMDASTISSQLASSLSHDGSAYDFMECIPRFGWYLDTRCVGAMQMTVNQSLVNACRFNKHCDAVVDVWPKRWCNCGCRGASLSWGMYESTYSDFVPCYMKVDYKCLLASIVRTHCAHVSKPVLTWFSDIVGVSGLYD